MHEITRLRDELEEMKAHLRGHYTMAAQRKLSAEGLAAVEAQMLPDIKATEKRLETLRVPPSLRGLLKFAPRGGRGGLARSVPSRTARRSTKPARSAHPPGRQGTARRGAGGLGGRAAQIEVGPSELTSPPASPTECSGRPTPDQELAWARSVLPVGVTHTINRA